MVADGLTKALPPQKHKAFIRQLRMEDIKDELTTNELANLKV